MHTPQHRPCCDASRSRALFVSSASPQKQVLETNALAGRMLYHDICLLTGGATLLCCWPRRSRLGRLSPWTEQAPGWFELKRSTQELLRLDLLGLSRRQLAFPLGAGGREARRGCRAWNCLDVQTTRALPGVISRSTPRSAASSYSCGAPQRSVSGANRVKRAARAPCRVPRGQQQHQKTSWLRGVTGSASALHRAQGAPAARRAARAGRHARARAAAPTPATGPAPAAPRGRRTQSAAAAAPGSPATCRRRGHVGGAAPQLFPRVSALMACTTRYASLCKDVVSEPA